MDKLDQVLMYSGGLDSTIAWEFLGRPQRVYCDLGHRYEAREEERLPSGVVIDRTVNLGVTELPDATIPARNLYLALVGARYANRVWLVVQEDEKSTPDRSRAFLQTASRFLSDLLGREIVVDTPFGEMDKTDMVGWWLAQGFPPETLQTAWTCYRPAMSGPEPQECGGCSACIRKFIALDLQGVDTLGLFAVDPRDSLEGARYVDRALKGEFSPKRKQRTLLALRPGGV